MYEEYFFSKREKNMEAPQYCCYMFPLFLLADQAILSML